MLSRSSPRKRLLPPGLPQRWWLSEFKLTKDRLRMRHLLAVENCENWGKSMFAPNPNIWCALLQAQVSSKSLNPGPNTLYAHEDISLSIYLYNGVAPCVCAQRKSWIFPWQTPNSKKGKMAPRFCCMSPLHPIRLLRQNGCSAEYDSSGSCWRWLRSGEQTMQSICGGFNVVNMTSEYIHEFDNISFSQVEATHSHFTRDEVSQ